MSVPIIGAMKILDYSVTLSAQCPCGAHILIIGKVGSIHPCGSCRSDYLLAGMPAVDTNPVTHEQIIGAAIGRRERPVGQ